MRFKKFIIINGRCFERNVIKEKGRIIVETKECSLANLVKKKVIVIGEVKD